MYTSPESTDCPRCDAPIDPTLLDRVPRDMQNPTNLPSPLHQSVTWEVAPLKGTPPEPRSGHTFTVIGTKAYLFGGVGRKDGTAAALGDLHALDLNNAELLNWTGEIKTPGAGPSARSRHTCTAVKHFLVVVGGLNHRTRYNDVWVFDTKAKVWTELLCEAKDVEDGVPSPRAHHTATLVGDQLFVFGGYGGHGKSCDDLFVLDFGTALDDKPPDVKIAPSWSKPVLKGKGPTPRFDHSMTWFPNKLAILGGRDNMTMHGDVHHLDLTTFTWLEEGKDKPRNYSSEIANHKFMGIESVPNHKLFCLTGKKGPNEFLNHVDVMDCGSAVWTTPSAIGEPPVAREDCAVTYDPKTCKILMFGGWANRWLGDTWQLNVSPIIGPPYAVFNVDPDIGPVFGETEVTIHGMQFKQSEKIEVGFRTGKTEVIAPGTFVNATKIKCLTPNFEEFGALEVEVRLNINNEGWTVNKMGFRYFANTAAKNCLAFGPGINPLTKAKYGVEISFLVLAKDTCNAKRTSGGDDFVVEVTQEDDPRAPKGTVRIVDPDNGLHEVYYSVPSAGRYKIDVGYDDLGEPQEIIPIRGSPFYMDFEDPWTYKRTSGAAPMKRKFGQITSLAHDKVALFGGSEDGVSVLSTGADGWSWDTADVAGQPEPRKHHGQTGIAGKLVVFGGALIAGEETDDLRTFEVEGTTGSWKTIEKVKPYRAMKSRHQVIREEQDAIEEAEKEAAAAAESGEAPEGEEGVGEAAPAEGEEPPAAPETPAPVEEEPPAVEAEAPKDDAPMDLAPAEPEVNEDGSPVPPLEPKLDEEGNPIVTEPKLDKDGNPIVPAPELGEDGNPIIREPEPEPEPEEPEDEDAAPLGPPPKRQGPAMTMLSHSKFVIFGGEAEEVSLEDYVTLDLKDGSLKWVEHKVEGKLFKPRKGAAMCAAGDAVYVFGGIYRDEDEDTEELLNDFFVLKMEGNVVTAEAIPLKGAVTPEARAFAMMQKNGTDTIMLFGGVNASAPINDGFAYNTVTQEWTRVFRADPAMATPTGELATLHEGQLLKVSSGGGNRFDVVAQLDLNTLSESFTFTGVMKNSVTKQIDALEKFFNTTEGGFGMADDPEKLEESFDFLLKVMGALYNVKTRKLAIDLELDCVEETLVELAHQKISTSANDKRLEEARVQWEAIKKMVPDVKEIVSPIQDLRGDEIKAKIATFTAKATDYRAEFLKRSVFTYDTGFTAAYPILDSTAVEVKDVENELKDLTNLANMFEFPNMIKESAECIAECREDLGMIKDIWDYSALVEKQFTKWRETLWNDIDTATMEDATKAFQKDVKALPKKLRATNAFIGLDDSVKNFLTSVPLVADLRSPDMRDRHWKSLMDVTGKQFVIDDQFSLDSLLALELHKFEDEVGEIVDCAQKEAKMEVSLAKLEVTWAKVEWAQMKHKDTDVNTIKLGEEDFEALEDNQVVVQGMLANRYMKTFEEAITGWNKKLMMVADVNQILSEIQRTWAYLESLFIHSDEVKKELPEAADRFKKIDGVVKQILKEACGVKNVVQSSNKAGLLKDLENQQGQLEMCEKALADYMESKRRAFPRFYFVSTADLLDILSNGNNPVKVMTHMNKCFQAIEKLTLDTEKPAAGKRPKAKGIVSCVGKETIPFKSEMTLAGKVEEYMNLIIEKMRSELKLHCFDAMQAYGNPKPRHEWCFDWSSQLGLVVNQIYWCQEVEAAFDAMAAGDAGAMKKYSEMQVAQITDLIASTKRDLDKPSRQKIMNMITIDAHSRDMVIGIMEKGETDKKCFKWMSQLRTYWDSDIDDSVIRICDASFPYGYEYLGNGGRLVITPLTDRIYITATQACWLSMGTAPAGPAGTGKTETSKDLSSQLGKSMYVFNCSPEMDYRSMGDIFKGLAASGSWGCFDEFNRLVPEVLSVCSVQYKCVTDAQKRKANMPGRGLDFVDKEGVKHDAIQNYKFVAADGVEMPLEEGCSGFITMNPGYIGRAELPESLKALFRPITVMVPDRQLIMENMLMAEGFVEAKMLAKKFASLYYLLEDMLSPQTHYDWGLRAIKSVLVVAGSLLRAEEGQDESDVLFRALRDFNIPKILAADMVIFMGLLGDLFIGVDPPRKRDMEFEKVIEQCTEEMGLTVEDDFTLRIVQLSELLAIRHCIFLMGVTGGGRTEVYRVLAKAIQKGVNLPEAQIVNDYLRSCNKTKVVIRDINPKAISTQEFYGYVNLSTREWKDGMMSYYMRELATIPDEDPKWIILDGDLDANWIESMNSTMDDNRLLTLPSNERIRLLPHMKLIFEIRNLKFATPATATRAGIVYVSEKLQWYNMIQSWIKRVVPEYAVKAKWKNPDLPSKYILELVDKYVPKTIFEMKKSFQHITPLETMNFCTTLVNVLEGMLRPENLNAKADQAAFESYFVLAMVWAFGGGLAPKDGIDYRKDFDKWWKRTWSAVKFPGKGSVFDYYINAKSGKFAPWADLVPEVEYDSQVTAMSSLFVPTAETSAFTYFLDMMLELKAPIMFVGPAGTGKTALVKGKLASQPEGIMSLNINFNYFTDVLSFQKILESQLEKKAGVNYGPPGQNKLIYFVDDLNMPKLDAYDTAMPISQIRQHLGWGHWFDRAKLTPKVIHNTQYVACMNPTAGAFTINPRLQRLFMTLAVDFPGQDSLMKIYGTFLNGHLKHFSADCMELGSKLIQASLANHEKVVASFRKTAVNFHYEFTVRHLSNVFQGLLSSTPDNFNDVNKLSKLWLHESERVYADRLVTVADLNTYNKNVSAIAGKFFKIPGIEDFYKKDDAKPLIFCHFAGGIEEKVYNDITEYSKLQKILEDTLEEYNETNATMNLVLFEDAMKHICRISRIISNPGGHALLVGVGGAGKQSLSKLSAHLCGMSTYMIVISGSYNVSSLKEDLQKMYKSAGLKGEGVLWLFTDSQITDEKFMVFINDLLSSGEIPDLFPPEDVDDIVNAVRGEAKAAGVPDSKEGVWKFFIDKVRTNLHMVFTCSPVGEQFRTRAQRFLAMINSTVIDWFQPWPEKALLGVSQRFLGETDLGTPEISSAVMKFMPYSFGLVAKMSDKFLEQERRFNYTTPKTFLELIKLYTSLLLDKRGATETNIERLSNGLDKLMKTQKDVDVLVEQAKVKAVEVAEKVESAGAFAAKVDVEKESASQENDLAQIEADKCAVIATEVSAKQVSVQADLDAAEPLVDQALAALDTLNKKDLGEAKSLKKPPAGVDDITAVVIILLQNNPKDKSWNAATKMMSNVDKFMDTLKGFKQKIDDGEVPKKSVDACRPYLELEHFNRDAIYNKSRAAAGLCEFAINIIKYFDVITMIEPKRQELAEANAQLDEANTKLAAVQEKVANLNALVADLERQFDEAEAEKNGAIDEKAKLDVKLGLANRLVNALAASGEQWKNTVAQLKIDAGVLVGDCLFAAAFVTYSGPFTAQFRNELVTAFQKNITENQIPMTEGIDVLKVLVDPATIAGWVGEGLPSDRTSIENGTITCNSERWPLMCDPQLQGIAWIKERESKNNLQVVRMGAPKTADIMEKAIENGTSVLIENMGETIDAVLMPTVTRATYKKGRSLYVKMGDKDVEYHPNFKLFLHTKMSNPHYPPEIQAETTLINFTVTQDGLEDQLLALVVNKERPDLEETKTALIIQNNEFTIKLKELEDTLLAKLADAEGDLTEDVELIESLEESKRVADEIVLKVAESKETEDKINTSREKYRVAAARGSLLFFMLNSLNKVHAFYAFSLNAFVTVFARGIDLAPGGKKRKIKLSFRTVAKRVMGKFDWNMDLLAQLTPSRSFKKSADNAKSEQAAEPTPEEMDKRLNALLETTTFTVYNYTRRGLFDKDKLIVSTLLTFSILLKDGKLRPDEYSGLINGLRVPVPPPISDDLDKWMSEAQWVALQGLETLGAFKGLSRDMEKAGEEWQEWGMHERCETEPLPGEWNMKLSDFQKLMLVRAVRPDRITGALSQFVERVMGSEYVNQDAFDAETMMAETGPSTPIFFILFPGYSPSKEIETLANQLGKTTDNGQLTMISMGQGQEPVAESVLDKYTKNGGWVFLDNVHLMQGWIPSLERKLEIAAESAHRDFRCFFSAEPINGNPFAKIVPESILQTCIKISNEPPSDLKSNMRRALAPFSQDVLDRSTTDEKKTVHTAVLFALCFYHSLLLGRKKFGVGIGIGLGSGLGYCRGYSFNMGDLVNCTEVLYNYLEGNATTPWEDMRYMFAEVFYGGHITDAMDRRLCVSYLDVLVVPDLLPGQDGAAPTKILAPGLPAPNPTSYADLKSYVENNLPPETPAIYGLHFNAQLSLLTSEGEILFKTIGDVSGGGGGGGGGGDDMESIVRQGVERMYDFCPEPFNIIEIESRIKDSNPYVVCALQEAMRMTDLLTFMKRSLEELTLGLDGALNMSPAMEEVQLGIYKNSVPPSWMKQMSTRVQEVYSLTRWYRDVQERHAQLEKWTARTLDHPKSVWLPGLFNAKAFITAVQQVYAREHQLPLDVMAFMTEVTKFSANDISEYSEEGAYIHGLTMEGARWDTGEGTIKDSKPKELRCLLPVIKVIPVTTDKYDTTGYYACPVYMNMQRANVYSAQVSTFTLKHPEDQTSIKWTLASVALLMQDELAA